MYHILEDKYEDIKPLNEESPSKEVIESLTNSIDNIKMNDPFDFSPINFKRKLSINKTTCFGKEVRKLRAAKTITSLNLMECMKEVEQSPLRKKSNAELIDKDSLNNTSDLTNIDITKPDFLDKFRKIEDDIKRPIALDIELIKEADVEKPCVNQTHSPSEESLYINNLFIYINNKFRIFSIL